MSPFEGYADEYDAYARCVILKGLRLEHNGALSDSMLMRVLEEFAINKDRYYLHTQLQWLQDQARAVTLRQAGTALIATLTEQGEAHLSRKSLIKGIQEPSRPRG